MTSGERTANDASKSKKVKSFDQRVCPSPNDVLEYLAYEISTVQVFCLQYNLRFLRTQTFQSVSLSSLSVSVLPLLSYSSYFSNTKDHF